jgi:hypothetical protein
MSAYADGVKPPGDSEIKLESESDMYSERRKRAAGALTNSFAIAGLDPAIDIHRKRAAAIMDHPTNALRPQ